MQLVIGIHPAICETIKQTSSPEFIATNIFRR